jgi:hypothetical protein
VSVTDFVALLHKSRRTPLSFIEKDLLIARISRRSLIGLFFIESAIEMTPEALKKKPRASLDEIAIAFHIL